MSKTGKTVVKAAPNSVKYWHTIWPVVGVISMINATCGTWPCLPIELLWQLVLMSSYCLIFNFRIRTIVCLSFTLLSTFILRYAGSGYTNVVFRLSLCLLGLKSSLYLVSILYFAVCWHSISSHHCNQAHSTTCQALFICKFQIPSIFP